MARAITVKVATPKVIKALETKLATLKSEFEAQEANNAKYDKAMEKYNKALIKFATDNIKLATNFRTNRRSWADTINIDFDIQTKGLELPEEPKRDYKVIQEWELRNATEEITNALNILKMTDEEYVNASTMKSIAQYL